MSDDIDLYKEEIIAIQKEIRDNLKKSPIIQFPDTIDPEELQAQIKQDVKKSIEKLQQDYQTDNTQKNEALKNYINEQLDLAIKDIVKSIVIPKQLDVIKISNIQEAKTDKVAVTNLNELKQELISLKKDFIATVEQLDLNVNVEQKELKLPYSPKEAIPVRLSDGKGFYNAIMTATGGGGGETDPLVGYQITERDDAGSTKYYGYAKPNGAWYILRESSTGSYRYSKGERTNSAGAIFADAWTDRVNLTYSYIYEVF